MSVHGSSVVSRLDRFAFRRTGHALVLILPGFFAAACASAASLDLTFQAVSAEVSFNGMPAAKIDLFVNLRASTDNLVNGGGYAGSDRYLNLKALFSSKALGLSDVEATTPLDVHIGATESNRPFKNATVLLASDGVVNGIFNLGAVENWNRTSSIGPLLGSATASGPLKVVLKDGNTLSITTLESAQPYGHALFEALIVPDRPLPAAPPNSSPKSVNGTMRKLGEKDLYLRTDGNKVLKFRLLARTRFCDEQGAAIRDSLLRQGDRLSVIVSSDDPEAAIGVVLVHKRANRGM